MPYLFDNISSQNNQWYSLNPETSALSKPFLGAYLTLSFANYSGIPPTDILVNSFYTYNCANCGTLDDTYFTNSNQKNYPLGYYDPAVIVDADSQATGVGWSVSNNAITPILTQTYANALMQKLPGNLLYRQLLSADTYRFTPDFPVTLVLLEQDFVVTRKNTDVAYAYFTQKNPKGAYQEDLVPNTDFYTSGLFADAEVDHTTELPFLTVLVLNQLNSIRLPSN